MIRFDSQYHLYDITPLENMFIQQYLVKSPGDYVKIYIYCLNLCYYPGGKEITYASVSSALKLSVDDIKRAFRYWTQLGVMSVSEEENDIIDIEMHSMKDLFLRSDFSDNVELYKFAAFNNQLSEAFSPRILDTQDYLLYQDMMTIFDVSEEYVIEAVKYSIRAAQSTDIPYKYVEKVIEARKNEGINTVEELRKYFETNSNAFRDTQKILRYLGMNRQPTVPEINCYKKWTSEYGFSFDAIREACNQTLNANNPTIKYLDTIITSLHEKKLSSAKEISTAKESSENYRSKVRKLLFYLGISGAPTAVQTEKYRKWENEYGYDDESIEIAASMISSSRNPFEALDALLESFSMKGISTADDMLAYMNQKHMFDEDIKQVHSVLGVTQEISENEREYMKHWKGDLKMPLDLILYAASMALSAEKPWRYMNKVLIAWADAGISNVKDAEAKSSGYQDKQVSPQKGSKKYAFKDMDNHSYSEEDYSDMFDNFGGFEDKR